MVRLYAAGLSVLALGANGRPLQVTIDGKTLPELQPKASLRHGVSFGQFSAEQLQSPGPAPGPAAFSPAAAEPAGLCGCMPVPQDQCTCGASLDFLKCVAIKCAAGDCECPAAPFEQECSSLSETCGSELDIEGCVSSTTTCEGRFHQATKGVIGLTLDTSHLTEEAYCGPYGRCTGELRLLANIYRPAPGAWLQCILPSKQESELWHCHAEVTADGGAECTIPMVPLLDPADALRGHCYLTEGKNGRGLTKEAWFVVRNRYDGSHAAGAAAATPKLAVKQKVTVKRVELKRASEDTVEKEAEIVEEEREEEIEEAGEQVESSLDKTAEQFKEFEESATAEAKQVSGGSAKTKTGVKTKSPKAVTGGSDYWWIPLVVISLIILVAIGLIMTKK